MGSKIIKDKSSNMAFRPGSMVPHSSVLAWQIPGMGEPGGLQSMGLLRVGHDRSDLAAAAAKDYGTGREI